eukprot:Rmarinus@m.7810
MDHVVHLLLHVAPLAAVLAASAAAATQTVTVRETVTTATATETVTATTATAIVTVTARGEIGETETTIEEVAVGTAGTEGVTGITAVVLPLLAGAAGTTRTSCPSEAVAAEAKATTQVENGGTVDCQLLCRCTPVAGTCFEIVRFLTMVDIVHMYMCMSYCNCILMCSALSRLVRSGGTLF